MKSIVLCENSVVENNKKTEEIEEINEEDSEKVTKKLTNGNTDEKTSKAVIQIIEIDSKSVCNGKSNELESSANKKSTEENGELGNLVAENLENGKNTKASADSKAVDSFNSKYGNVSTINSTLAVKDSLKNKNSFSDTQENMLEISDSSDTIVFFEEKFESKNLGNKSMVLESEKCSKNEKSSQNEKLNKPIVIESVVSVEEESENEKEKISEPIHNESVKKAENVQKDKDKDTPVETSTFVNVSQKLSFLTKDSTVGVESKKESEEEKEEIERPMAAILLDVDENKENEKDNKIDVSSSSRDDYVVNEESRFEIQVGECQTIFDSEKNSLWIEKAEEDTEENSFYTIESTPESTKNDSLSNEAEKSDSNEMECLIVENENKNEVDVSKEEESEIEEIDPVNDKLKSTIEETTKMDLDVKSVNACAEENKRETNKTGCPNLRKRQLSVDANDNKQSTAKKKKKMSDGAEDTEIISVQDQISENSSLGENSTHENLCKELLASKPVLVSSKNTADKNAKKLRTSTERETERRRTRSTEKVALSSSFWTSLRGTLKSMTRSDLEELIVQKLCEVITERSTVGELRRRAQALEQDQEKWKGKVQSLTKLLKEMEMVMKKYMSEVQKQTKNGDSRVVTPLRVTRSVGLQVSFFSSGSRGSKPVSPQIVTPNPVQNVNGRNNKQSPSKLPSPINAYPKNSWNKPGNQKSSAASQKSPVIRQKKSIPSRNDYSLQQNRPQVPQPINRSPLVPNQSPGTKTYSKSSVTQPPPQPQLQQQQQQQQQQNNSSKVIDLTEDDDRQPNIGKSSGSIRVLNHLTSPQLSQNKRFTYILPAGTASPPTTIAGGQNRQVLIAAPATPQTNRPLMCSMPPLLFKGGNVVQQTGAQPPMLNQPNRIILPKSLRHPAPLPQPPPNQSNRPNLKLLPPRPALKISKVQTGIVLSWNMSLSPEHAPISSYQLYAYQEGNSPPATSLWKKVGDVKALPLPMACTLTQFMSGHKYHFAVRAVDLHSRIGPFSFPGTIVLVK